MAVDDYLESEVAVAAAATAALLSPQVRGVLRKGMVYATAGVMTAGDAVGSVAKGAGRGMKRVAGKGGEAASTAPAVARRTPSRAGRTTPATPESPGVTTPAENPAGA